MYLEHYGLHDKPFRLGHDSSYYFGASHQVPMNELFYSIEERQGLAVALGEPGLGKTTLLKRFLDSFGEQYQGIHLSEPSIGHPSLLAQIAVGVGVDSNAVDLMTTLASLWARAARSGHTVVLVIDEAQSLTLPQFEEIRYLSNLEVDGNKLLEIVLAGQPQLQKKMASTELEALRQRVAVRVRLKPMTRDVSEAYIRFRLAVAGAQSAELFAPHAFDAIQDSTHGVPRLINIVCDRALVVGYVESVQRITKELVEEALDGLDLEDPVSEPPDTGALSATNDADPMDWAAVRARLDAIDDKLDRLIDALDERGPELANFGTADRPQRPESSTPRVQTRDSEGDIPRVIKR